ncbi:hypothetical protein [Amycolatopsis sp. cmx-4-61]|uniref:hypothetical protein n=1 Tax=Amycolatopsis sp. cmx-4-61 TaxID=2790937 RepID=UPI003978B7DC
MPQKPQACTGSGRPPSHTYTRRVSGSGGVVRDVQAGNCSVNHHEHYDLPVISGAVAPHAE